MKISKKTVNIMDLVSVTEDNARLENNYDLAAMKEAILAVGRIIEPMLVERMPDKTLHTRQGHRRTRAAQELYLDPNTPQGVKDALSKVEVIVHEDLTDAERLRIIYDHGGKKGLCSTEVILSVWKLHMLFKSMDEIAGILYYELAKFTGHTEKLLKVPAEGKERKEFLKTWFRGTLDSFILAVAGMTQEIKDQFILSHKNKDGLLLPGEVVTINLLKRDRVSELSKAKNFDKDERKGGTGWTFEHGGETFNALVQKYKDVDAGKDTEVKEKRPTANALRERAGNFQCSAVRKALLFAAGDQDQIIDLVNADAEYTAMADSYALLRRDCTKIKDENVREFVITLLKLRPADVELAMKALTGGNAVTN